MENQSSEWYVVPGDAKTNESIAALLNLTCEATGNEITFVDNTGRQRSGWRVEYRIVAQLTKNKRSMGLLFTVYVREPGRPPRLNTLHKKKYKSAQRLKAESDLARIRKK